MYTTKNYEQKYFSVLGDSISTLRGYSIPEDAAFYTHSNCLETGVFIPSDTWWGQVIERLGGKLMVNDSFSGSTVCKHPQYEVPSYACSTERTSDLGKYGCTPDVIMIFMGINDWGRGTPIASESEDDLSRFSCAYEKMLKRLKEHYPEAELWCLTLPVSTCSESKAFRFPYSYGGIHIEEYSECIRSCVRKNNVRLIELYDPEKPYDTVDGFHPTARGMQTLAHIPDPFCQLRFHKHMDIFTAVVNGKGAAFQIGRTKLYEISTEYLGCGLAEYIRRQRIRHAQRLLTQTNLSVTEIASAVGLSDYNHFSKIFKQVTGISAREYRKRS